MTAAVLAAPPDAEFDTLPEPGPGQEFVDGQLQERHVSFLSSFIAGNIYFALRSYVQNGHLGWVSSEGTSYKCFADDPTRTRRVDVAFHKLDRLTVAQAQAEGFLSVVPDLVVEVVSPNDLAENVNRKRLEWLAAGATLVWVVFPHDQEIHAFAAGGPVRVYGPADTLAADPVLAGFAVAVSDLFKLPA